MTGHILGVHRIFDVGEPTSKMRCTPNIYDLWDALVTVCVVLLKFEELYYLFMHVIAPIFKNRMGLLLNTSIYMYMCCYHGHWTLIYI